MPVIFSYGTLQRPEMQVTLFGRLLDGRPDALPGFEPSLVRIENPATAAALGGTHHHNVRFNGRPDSHVDGTALEVTDAELAAADGYERDEDYERLRVTLASGRDAWVYRRPAFRLRDARAEDAAELARVHVQAFAETHGAGPNGGPPVSLRERQWGESLASDSDVPFTIAVVDEDGVIVGFARGARHDGGVPGFAGELTKIYLLRKCQGQGAGRLLLGAAARRFLDRGMTSMLLFGDPASRSNGFYERFGAERLYSPDGAFHGGYGWRDLPALVTANRF